jgi:hypothetical protein
MTKQKMSTPDDMTQAMDLVTDRLKAGAQGVRVEFVRIAEGYRIRVEELIAETWQTVQ